VGDHLVSANAALYGKDPIQGAISSLHNPLNWINSYANGGPGGYSSFQ
jgi:hypothetical protein